MQTIRVSHNYLGWFKPPQSELWKPQTARRRSIHESNMRVDPKCPASQPFFQSSWDLFRTPLPNCPYRCCSLPQGFCTGCWRRSTWKSNRGQPGFPETSPKRSGPACDFLGDWGCVNVSEKISEDRNLRNLLSSLNHRGSLEFSIRFLCQFQAEIQWKTSYYLYSFFASVNWKLSGLSVAEPRGTCDESVAKGKAENKPKEEILEQVNKVLTTLTKSGVLSHCDISKVSTPTIVFNTMSCCYM